jgi:hypothetical protein
MILLLATTSLLAACAVGPDYKAPKTAAVAAAPFVGAANPAFTRDAVQDRWWTLYNDPVLTRMVEDALAANTDIRVAAARVERARAMLRNAKAARLPTTSIDASATRDRFSSVQFGTSSAAREAWYYDGGLSLSYEVDLFGRVRRGVEAANGDADATDADAVRLAVVADTVRAYLDVTTSAQRLKVAQDTVALLDQSIRITGARVDVGRSDRLDLIRVTALRDQQAATIPRSPDRQTALLRLATLTGRAPQDLPADVARRSTRPIRLRPFPWAMARHCWRAVPMCGRQSGVWPPIRRASAWRRRTSIRASHWADRSARRRWGHGCAGPGLFALVAGAAGQLDLPQYGRRAGAHQRRQGGQQGLAGHLRRHGADRAGGDGAGIVHLCQCAGADRYAGTRSR